MIAKLFASITKSIRYLIRYRYLQFRIWYAQLRYGKDSDERFEAVYRLVEHALVETTFDGESESDESR